MPNPKKTLVVLDAQSILHRAYHALPSFTSPQGEPTGALYGFTAMLLKILRELRPDYIVASYDLAKPTFRHVVYKEYKAHRPETAEELSSQIDVSKEILQKFNIPIYEKEGYEADDLIATIVERTKKQKDIKIIVASGDLDALALVEDEKVRVYTLKKGIEEQTFYGEKEVQKRFGFSPKFMSDFKGLKGDPSDNIPGVKGIGEKTASQLIQKFGHLEDILAKAKSGPDELKEAGFGPKVIKSLQENQEEALFSKSLASLKKDVSFEFKPLETNNWQKYNKEQLIKLFQSLGFKTLLARLEEIGLKETHNFSFDKERAGHLSIMYWLLDSRRTNPKPEEILFSLFPGKRPSAALFPGAVEILEKEVAAQELEKVLKEIELPLIPVLSKMKSSGILTDAEKLKKLTTLVGDKIEKIEKEIFKIMGEEFNPNSHQEVRRVLFEKLKINYRGLRRTTKGVISTSIPELLKIKKAHPIIEKIIKHRELAKLKSGYLESLPQFVQKDKRIHPDYLITSTATGRLSARNPNLQNIPLENKEIPLREIFIAPKDYLLVSFDYSQIELRLAAHFSQDENLIKAFREEKDIHVLTASKIFNTEEEKITPEMRNFAKTINFGILYGMGARSLAENLETSLEEAQSFLDGYFIAFPQLLNYIEDVKKEAGENGYVLTLFGRKRFIPEIGSGIERIRREGERKAINFPIQGSAADLIKLAMIQINEFLKDKKDVKLVLQIHDELIFEVKEEAVKKLAPEIKKIMEQICSLKVPLKVDIKSGKNWGALKNL